MGCYDFIEGPCPSTGATFSSQTKLMDCIMKTYRVGDGVPSLPDGRLKLKEPCEHCGTYHTVVVQNGHVHRIVVAQPDDPQEGLYGTTLAPEDSREAQFAREVLSQVAEKLD